MVNVEKGSVLVLRMRLFQRRLGGHYGDIFCILHYINNNEGHAQDETNKY